MNNLTIEKRGKGRPPKVQAPVSQFDPRTVQIIRGADLKFDESVFIPIPTGTLLDHIFSTGGGVMPATNMIIAGGPGSGKSTLVLDALARIASKGKKVLFVAGEMDQIGHYKYCRRMHLFAGVQTLFLRDYAENLKETIEFVFAQGWDVIGVDSIAEVIEMYKDTYHTTESAAEMWLLDLQNKHKKGENTANKNTTFLNIQQTTKAGGFAGSNRLKHMTDAMCHVDRIKDSDSRKVYFSKNRDCDTNSTVLFRIGMNQVEYSYPEADEE